MDEEVERIPLKNGQWIKVFNDEKIVTNCELISFSCVLDRWKGATESEIHTIVVEGKLGTYIRIKSLKKSLGLEHHLFPSLPGWNNYGDGYFQNTGSLVCLLQDILDLEERYPDFLCETVPESEALSIPPEPAPISCTSYKAKDSNMSGLETELCEMREELAKALQRAQAAEQALSGTPQQTITDSLSPAQKAAQIKSEKTLIAWKPAIKAMIQVAVRCGAEGKALRQRPDFYDMFYDINATLTDTQMAFFRSSLPEGYSDPEGGKSGKVCPPLVL